MVFGRLVILLIDPHDKGFDIAFGRGGYDYLRCASVKMATSGVAVTE